MTALICWLDELDDALVRTESTADAGHRLDALIEEGMALLAGEPPVEALMIDAGVVDRVQRRLWTIADQITDELEAVRCTRRELADQFERQAAAGLATSTVDAGCFRAS